MPNIEATFPPNTGGVVGDLHHERCYNDDTVPFEIMKTLMVKFKPKKL